MLDRTFCSVEEILDKCKTCLRNDKHRIDAVANSDRNSVSMSVAKPIKRGSEELCDMYLTRKNNEKSND